MVKYGLCFLISILCEIIKFVMWKKAQQSTNLFNNFAAIIWRCWIIMHHQTNESHLDLAHRLLDLVLIDIDIVWTSSQLWCRVCTHLNNIIISWEGSIDSLKLKCSLIKLAHHIWISKPLYSQIGPILCH